MYLNLFIGYFIRDKDKLSKRNLGICARIVVATGLNAVSERNPKS